MKKINSAETAIRVDNAETEKTAYFYIRFENNGINVEVTDWETDKVIDTFDGSKLIEKLNEYQNSGWCVFDEGEEIRLH